MINHTSDPDHGFPVVHQLLDAGAGYAPVTNLIAVGDPDVRQIDGQWWMYVGAAFSDGGGEPIGVNLFSASLPPGEPWQQTAGPSPRALTTPPRRSPWWSCRVPGTSTNGYTPHAAWSAPCPARSVR